MSLVEQIRKAFEHEDNKGITEVPKINQMGGGRAAMEGRRGPILYARKGELVTCEKGHVICEVGRNIWFGQPYGGRGIDFINWRQLEPLINATPETIKCSECGAKWYMRGQVFHFAEGGWRYNNGEGALRGEWPDRPATAPGIIIPGAPVPQSSGSLTDN